MASPLAFIEDRLELLRTSERSIANVVLADPPGVIHMSISDLADASRVSEASVLRFSRALGFKGYQEFKITLAQAVVPLIKGIHGSVEGSEQLPELAEQVFEANIGAIRDSLVGIDYEVLDQVVGGLAGASRIVLHGIGGSAAVAKDAYHKFFRLGLWCEWFEDTHMGVMASAMLKSGDVLFVVSHSGSTKDIVRALEVANKAGATTVALVCARKSPVSRAAQHVLAVKAPEAAVKFEPVAGRVAQLTMIDLIAAALGLRRREIVAENLGKTRMAVAGSRY